MATFLIAFSVVMLAGLLVKWLQFKRSRTSDDNEHRNRRHEALDTVAAWPPESTLVLTLPERKAHQLLTRALPDHIVLAQVPLSRFLRIPTRNSYHEWMRRVGRLCADLVVCRTSSQVVAVVNIRGAGKESERGRKRHERIDRVLNKAGIYAFMWAEDALPPIGQVRALVLGPAAPPLEAAAKHDHADARPQEPSAPASAVAPDLEEASDGADLVQPTPSTFFDDFDSAPVPLQPPSRP